MSRLINETKSGKQEQESGLEWSYLHLLRTTRSRKNINHETVFQSILFVQHPKSDIVVLQPCTCKFTTTNLLLYSGGNSKSLCWKMVTLYQTLQIQSRLSFIAFKLISRIVFTRRYDGCRLWFPFNMLQPFKNLEFRNILSIFSELLLKNTLLKRTYLVFHVRHCIVCMPRSMLMDLL